MDKPAFHCRPRPTEVSAVSKRGAVRPEPHTVVLLTLILCTSTGAFGQKPPQTLHDLKVGACIRSPRKTRLRWAGDRERQRSWRVQTKKVPGELPPGMPGPPMREWSFQPPAVLPLHEWERRWLGSGKM